MSGPGKPFREYVLQKVDKVQCPLPGQVSGIRDYDTCMVAMQQCSRHANDLAVFRNDPRYEGHARWFDQFAHDNSAVTTILQSDVPSYEHATNNLLGRPEKMVDFTGGCQIFLVPDAEQRNRLWAPASAALSEELTRIHTGQPGPARGTPMVTCEANPGIDNYHCMPAPKHL